MSETIEAIVREKFRLNDDGTPVNTHYMMMEETFRSALTRAAEGRWVKVSERLPEPDVDVICYWRDTLPCAIGSYCPEREKVHGTGWQDANGSMPHFDADPTHWKELDTPE